MLPGAAVAGSRAGGGPSLTLDSWAAPAEVAVPATAASETKHHGAPSWGQAPGAAPSRGAARSPRGARSALARAGKGLRAGAPRADLIRHGIPRTMLASPERRRVEAPRAGRGASLQSRHVRAAGSPAPGALLSSESRASAPAGRSAPERLGWAETAQVCPERSRRGGLPQGHPECPHLTVTKGRGGRSAILPFLMQTLPPLSPPGLASSLIEDGECSYQPGRIIEPKQAVNLAVPGAPRRAAATRQARDSVLPDTAERRQSDAAA